jgi:hypothetical protein
VDCPNFRHIFYKKEARGSIVRDSNEDPEIHAPFSLRTVRPSLTKNRRTFLSTRTLLQIPASSVRNSRRLTHQDTLLLEQSNFGPVSPKTCTREAGGKKHHHLPVVFRKPGASKVCAIIRITSTVGLFRFDRHVKNLRVSGTITDKKVRSTLLLSVVLQVDTMLTCTNLAIQYIAKTLRICAASDILLA